MARENNVFLIGKVVQKPQYNLKKDKMTFLLQTYRRNEKVDELPITVYNEKLFPMIEGFHVNDFIVMNGTIVTKTAKRGVICPSCKKLIVMDDAMDTMVIGTYLQNIGSNHNLISFKEVSNRVQLLGSLCVEPIYSIIKGGTTSLKFQLAVNRRKYISQMSETNTDFPWVVCFGERAEEAKKHLQISSQVYLVGGIQAREVGIPVTCEHCKKTVKVSETLLDVVTYYTEFLDKCIFEEPEVVPLGDGLSSVESDLIPTTTDIPIFSESIIPDADLVSSSG